MPPHPVKQPVLDSQLTQALLAVIRQLRQDPQNTAAIIQRVQIVMYRVQTGEPRLNRATERLDNARAPDALSFRWGEKC